MTNHDRPRTTECPKCGHKIFVNKLWCWICEECRVVVEYKDQQQVKVPVEIEDQNED